MMSFIGKQLQRARSLASNLRSLCHVNARINAAVAAAQKKTNTEVLPQLVMAAARQLATQGDHRQLPPFDVRDTNPPVERKLRIGLFDNLANQAYITARALRKLGHDVEVIIQENGFDSYPLARPQWEECEVEITNISDFQPETLAWEAPNFVRYVPYEYDNNPYIGRIGAADEVAGLYRENFGKELPQDAALVLAQYMTQWNYIRAMNDYDVVMLSMGAIMFGAFSPKPVVICPLGGDLHMRGFDLDVRGLMFRAGFRQAAHLALPETDYFAYIDRMESKAPRSFMPLIVDTDIYAPGEESQLRAEWQAQVGGECFLLGVCRQDWVWKGSDKLIRAFARFRQQSAGKDWRLLLQAWGADIEKSRALISELGLDSVTIWLPMCSKPLLRRRQRAADAIADQFVMEGYGASVLESLAAGKAVVIRPVPQASQHHFRTGPPPFVGATSENDIVTALTTLASASERERIGAASRAWVEREHGYKALGPLYMKMFEAAAKYPNESPHSNTDMSSGV